MLLFVLPGAENILLCTDTDGRTFLHTAAFSGTAAVIHSVFTVLPKSISIKLTKVKDNNGQTACDISRVDENRDWLHHAGSYQQGIYDLITPPRILLFYSTKGRQTETMGLMTDDAEAERKCVEAYFQEREMPCIVTKDPTADQLMSTISAAQADETASGLVVFLMAHGEYGLVNVEGDPGFIYLQDIITHMGKGMNGKPKVNAVVFVTTG